MIIDTREKLIEVSGVVLPEEFLKNWLFVINEQKIAMEDIDRDFGQFTNFMKWDILKKHIVTIADIKVESEDIVNEAKKMAAAQLMQYGMSNPNEEMVENFSKHILENKEEKRKIFDSLYDTRVVEYIASKAVVVEKEVTIEEFRELVK